MDYLLQSRLRAPTPPSPCLPREALLNRLDLVTGDDTRLVYITGPAGSGKTVLMRQIAGRWSGIVAWYSVEVCDCEPGAFAANLLAAIEQGSSDGAGILSARRSDSNTLSFMTAVADLARDLEESGGRIAVFIDNIHILEKASEVMDDINTLLRHLPSGSMIYAASRHCRDARLFPPRGHILEIASEDLACDLDDIRSFLRLSGVEESDGVHGDRIFRATQGWMAGAVILCRQHILRSSGPASARADSMEVIYALFEDLCLPLDEGEWRFLKSTAVPGRFDRRMAYHLFGGESCEHILNDLRRRNLFLFECEEPGVFRYHPLFRKFLLRNWEGDWSGENLRAVHRAAADYFTGQGTWDEALHHCCSGCDWGRAASILEEKGDLLIRSGSARKVLGWIEEIPRDLKEASFKLLRHKAKCHEILGHWPIALSAYDRSLALARERDAMDWYYDALGESVYCHHRMGNFERLRNELLKALELCPDSSYGLLAFLHGMMGLSCLEEGSDWENGFRHFDESVRRARQSGDRYLQGWAVMLRAHYLSDALGEFERAMKDLNGAEEIFEELGCPDQLTKALIGKGTSLCIRGYGAESLDLLARAEHLAESTGHRALKDMAILYQVLNHTLANRLDDASARLESLREHELAPFLLNQFAPIYALFLARSGNLMGAKKHLEVSCAELGEERLKGFRGIPTFLIYGRVLALIGNSPGGLEKIEHALAMAREGRSRYWEFLGLYFLHHYHELHGNTQASREALDQFIGLCAEEGYEFFFYRDMGAIAVETLLRLLRLDIMPGYVSQIIANLPGEAKDAIVGLLSHNDVEIRLAALSACALLDMGHARRAFRKALSDSSVLVRRRARKLNAALPPERPRYEFHSLGSFEVMRGGIALPLSSWPRKKAKNLFKYLLANEGRMIALEQILEEFWPDMQPEKAILNLRTTLNNLRRAIEPHIKGGQISDLIFTTDRTMGLIIREPHFWDVRAFREKASWGRTYTAQGDLAKALEVYEEGLALYRGDFLEENVYDDWARAVRSEIRELHLQVLENCASCHLGRGQTSQALTRFRQLLAHEPFREDIHRTIIELYLRLENRNAALEQYRQFREILSELDIEPPQETKDLVEKILKVRIDAAR